MSLPTPKGFQPIDSDFLGSLHDLRSPRRMKMAEVSLDSSATVLTALATITTAATFATSIFSGVVFVVVVAIVPGTRQAVLSCRQRTSDQVSIF